MRQPKKIKLDPKNAREHNEENKALINKSLTELGAGRSILLDNENIVIAGNGVYEQAEALGIPVRVIESDGKELIAIKRTDLSFKDKKRKELSIVDNSATDKSSFKEEIFKDEHYKEVDFESWGAIRDLINIVDIETSEGFVLPSGEKLPFQSMTFVLSDEQVDSIKRALERVIKTDDCKNIKKMGNENSNGNALYLIISQWEERKK